MVSEPPFSMLRAAPRKRRGIDAAGENAAARGLRQVVGAGQARDGIQQDNDVLPLLDQALGALDDELGHLDVVLGGHVEGGGDHLPADGALHVGRLFGTLVDQQYNHINLRVILRDSIGYIFQQHGLTRLRRCNDQSTLSFTDRRKHIDHTSR